MKKFISILLSLVLIISLVACAKEDVSPTINQNEEPTNETVVTDPTESVESTQPTETTPNPTEENEENEEQPEPEEKLGGIEDLIKVDAQFAIFEPTGSISKTEDGINEFKFIKEIDQLLKEATYIPTWLDASQIQIGAMATKHTWGDIKTKYVRDVALMIVELPGFDNKCIMSFHGENPDMTIQEAFDAGYWALMLGEDGKDIGTLLEKRNDESAAEAILRVLGQPQSVVFEANPYGLEFLSKYAAMFNYETENFGLQLCINESQGIYLFTMTVMGKPVVNN